MMNLPRLMPGCNNKTQAFLSLRYGGIIDRLQINAMIPEQCISQPAAMQGVTNRQDGDMGTILPAGDSRLF